jgi:hypothetical protein
VTELSDVLGALMVALENAQATADHQTLAIGELYRRHELLQHFPVPRAYAAELEVELQFAVVERSPVAIDLDIPETQAMVASAARTVVRRVITDGQIVKKRPASSELARLTQEAIDAVLGETKRLVEGNRIADIASDLVARVTDWVRRTDSRHFRVDTDQLDQMMPTLVSFAVAELEGRTRDLADNDGRSLEVLVTEGEMGEVPSSRLSRLKLRLVRGDPGWSVIPVDDQPEARLIL